MYKYNKIYLIPVLTLLTACGGSSSSPSGPASSNLVAASSSGTANMIQSYSPAGGTYTTVPTQVVITLETTSIDPNTAGSDSSYSIACGGNPLSPQSVSVSGQTITVNLPSITGLVNGTTCTFTVNSNVMDQSGNFLSGTHTVTYTLSSSGTVLSGNGNGVWNEQGSPSDTSSIGSDQGTPFSDQGSTGVVMTGIMVDSSGSYVDGIQGLWSNGFSDTNTAAGPLEGMSGNMTTLSCPSGMRMTGIVGNSGSFVDSIAIVCMNEAQSQSYTSSSFGGSGGSSYSLSCPSGMFATDLNGVSDSYLNELSLGCQ
jgi:hypothetical protein